VDEDDYTGKDFNHDQHPREVRGWINYQIVDDEKYATCETADTYDPN